MNVTPAGWERESLTAVIVTMKIRAFGEVHEMLELFELLNIMLVLVRLQELPEG